MVPPLGRRATGQPSPARCSAQGGLAGIVRAARGLSRPGQLLPRRRQEDDHVAEPAEHAEPRLLKQPGSTHAARYAALAVGTPPPQRLDHAELLADFLEGF